MRNVEGCSSPTQNLTLSRVYWLCFRARMCVFACLQLNTKRACCCFPQSFDCLLEPCVCILRKLVYADPSLRHSLAQRSPLLLALLRGTLTQQFIKQQLYTLLWVALGEHFQVIQWCTTFKHVTLQEAAYSMRWIDRYVCMYKYTRL